MERADGRAVSGLLEIARSEGVAVLGMDSCGAMVDEAPGYRPEDILSHARSMVCFGIPVPRGVLSRVVEKRRQVYAPGTST